MDAAAHNPLSAWALIVLAAIAAATSCGRSDLFVYPPSPPAIQPVELAELDGGAPDGGPIGCLPGRLSLIKATPKVMFVLDQSGSMSERFGTTNRWGALTQALSAALPSVDQSMEIGAVFFPATNYGVACSVSALPALMPKTGNVTALLEAMTVAVPSGQTPTASAIAATGTAMLSLRAATAARAMVLATDGAPNCNAGLDVLTCDCRGVGLCSNALMCLDDDRTAAEIRGWKQKGLPTYVIGIQEASSVSFVDTLNAMAVAGGRPLVGKAQSYYAATSADELQEALIAIRQQVGACVYLTTSVPDLNGAITVWLNDRLLVHDETGRDGWRWGNKANGEIELLGNTCADATALKDPVVTAQIECGDYDGGI